MPVLVDRFEHEFPPLAETLSLQEVIEWQHGVQQEWKDYKVTWVKTGERKFKMICTKKRNVGHDYV